MNPSKLYPVILAGGSGSRFWPLSRELYPKQLLKLIGEETMLQRTLRCAMSAAPPENIHVVTHRRQADPVRMQAAAVVSLPPDHILAEPKARNTAAAIGLAAAVLNRKDPEAVMVVMPSDHVILKNSAFARAVRAAGRLAVDGWLVTFGIKAAEPETGYGYIRRGRPLRSRLSKRGAIAYEVGRFTEKPDRATARRYVSDGRFYWNSGIFVWKASVILDAIRQLQPRLYRGLAVIQAAMGTSEEEKTIEDVYDRLEAVSIDYGILERLPARGGGPAGRAGLHKKLAVLPVDMGWSDVGSWTALEQISRPDSMGNVTVGNVIDLDSRNSILYADKRLVATIGLEDVIVVDTEDATLVCRKSRAQDVRTVVATLQRRNAEEHRVHRTVWRPWGSYTVLENGDRYKIKRILVNPKARLSLQLHHRRSEHWVVVSGAARVTCGERVYDLGVNEGTYIPMDTKHRLENPGAEPLQIIEVQNGDYLGEDDIVRFQDDYGRRGSPA
ncbi:MAG TPA: mannose-1-phosphate guanylyltransferase/mannose-6-phosphate isomerase [Nitrospiria bacterium]|nr:mannose-1-phosphate guanylyltransferase/mannose-6-phosphate isomerase [Nitrospiria bacterium]